MAINGNAARGDSWEAQLRKGCLEMAILASLWNGRLYGLEILRALSSRSKMDIAEGTVYPILARLKTEGMLQSEWVEAEAGHPRKYYWLTPAGRRRLKDQIDSWTSFSSNLTAMLQPIVGGKDK
jgi:PadR family transcriptional regulator PadR